MENIYLGEKLGQLQLDNMERGKENVHKPRKKEIELSDHIQFLITEKSGPKKTSVDERDQADESDVELTGGNGKKKETQEKNRSFVEIIFVIINVA